MWLPSPSIILSLLITLPLVLGAPADTPATTTLLSVTPTPSSIFPLQTPQTSPYPHRDRDRQDGKTDDPAKIAHLLEEPSQTLTAFVAAPTGQDGKVQHWYIVTYWSCVLVLPPVLFILLNSGVAILQGHVSIGRRAEEKDVWCLRASLGRADFGVYSTFSNDYVHCGYHTPVRPGVGPDGSYFDDGGRKEVWIAGVVVGVLVAVVGAVVI